MDLTLLRSLNMRRNAAGGAPFPNTSGQDLGKEVVELDDLEQLERRKEKEEMRKVSPFF